jgi:hypothetical protein
MGTLASTAGSQFAAAIEGAEHRPRRWDAPRERGAVTPPEE